MHTLLKMAMFKYQRNISSLRGHFHLLLQNLAVEANHSSQKRTIMMVKVIAQASKRKKRLN